MVYIMESLNKFVYLFVIVFYFCKKISDFWVNEKFIMREIIKVRVW